MSYRLSLNVGKPMKVAHYDIKVMSLLKLRNNKKPKQDEQPKMSSAV